MTGPPGPLGSTPSATNDVEERPARKPGEPARKYRRPRVSQRPSDSSTANVATPTVVFAVLLQYANSAAGQHAQLQMASPPEGKFRPTTCSPSGPEALAELNDSIRCAPTSLLHA
eukprot:CAMPEP_0181206072 /NCGR_PEP_ID=MMETSP1096-20121128/20833_1 /TAXON_ID=156174 ORGANISM="Chrysochromulina ericina, Strain CCMP281" /NCGR_SAMPLE_ID=MMETSP1096 /ASSEMBLY_ACC=CAM_ASM_000453 /LENGTH=114 /DNA_ID=CAMNT_0023296933 /DNA_START=674 /DNA_END=1018 /DNA_ORIENTATION=+